MIVKNIFIFLLGLQNLSAQTDSVTFLNQLEGKWSGKGEAMGADAETTMQWQKALDGKFYRITYTMQFTSNGSKQRFEGLGYYKSTGNHTYEGTWFDNGGEMHHIQSIDDGYALASLWGNPGAKYGKTEYKLVDNNTVEILDHIQLKDGSWRLFAKNILKKQ